MLALVLTALLTGAVAQECVKDNRVQPLTAADFRAREQIQGFSKDGMWKMPKLAQHATEEQLEDCASCTDAEVQVELMQAQMGENPLLNEIDGVYYPVQQVYTPQGFKLNYKDIPHVVPKNVKGLIEHRMGSLDIQIESYRQMGADDATRLLKNHEEMEHIMPAGLGPVFLDAKTIAQGKKAASLIVQQADKDVAEYASMVRVLKDIEKGSSHGTGTYLILKEGFVPSTNFKSLYKKAVNEAPKDWDMLFLRTGPSKNVGTRCEDKIAGLNMFEMRRPSRSADGNTKFYQGIDAYVIRRQSISKVLQYLRHQKAGPLSELLMSVHNEEKVRRNDGKIDYKVDGIYSYMLTDNMLTTVAVPRPPQQKQKPGAKETKVVYTDKKDEKSKDVLKQKNTNLLQQSGVTV